MADKWESGGIETQGIDGRLLDQALKSDVKGEMPFLSHQLK